MKTKQFNKAVELQRLMDHCDELINYTNKGFMKSVFIRHVVLDTSDGRFGIDEEFQEDLAKHINLFFKNHKYDLQTRFDKL